VPQPDLRRKLAILADAAKYDASCASSGSQRRRAAAPGAVGNTEGMGICHSYTPDGRCVSLLKVLLTNWCVYDCAYCVNRRSSGVERARFKVEELVGLVLDFYRRNYIEGLFLSSGIIRSADYTMEQLVGVARSLRRDHHFNGYIHLKTIPEASVELVAEAGRWADRLSINVELPTQAQLDVLAPEKRIASITRTMGQVRDGIADAREGHAWARSRGIDRGAPRFAPAGQTTQMIVGATDAPDAVLLRRAASLYDRQRLRRVYYSAFSPIPDASSRLPLVAPPLVREHRLYQADWLMRFYGFAVDELAPVSAPSLDLDVDPKLGWALRNRDWFPVDVNAAARELLLRVPGFGRRTVERLVRIRRWRRIRLADLVTLRVPVKRALPFVVTADHTPHLLGLDALDLRARLAPARQQLDLFATAVQARTGEL
jgi:putative DNA modification/repair radical SAM protein